MKSILLMAFLIIPVLSALVEGGKVERLGTYDSRAIEVAFVGSEVFQKTEGKVITQKKRALEIQKKEPASLEKLKKEER